MWRGLLHLLPRAGLKGRLATLGRDVLAHSFRIVMSGEPEDSKPKLNLVISHSGTRTSSLVCYRR